MQNSLLLKATTDAPKKQPTDDLVIEFIDCAPYEADLDAPEGAAVYHVYNMTKRTGYFVALYVSPASGEKCTVCQCESRLQCKHRRLALATHWPEEFTVEGE